MCFSTCLFVCNRFFLHQPLALIIFAKKIIFPSVGYRNDSSHAESTVLYLYLHMFV